MSRILSITESIHLPRLTAARAMTLAQQLATTASAQEAASNAQGESLPKLISRPLKRMTAAASALEVQIGPVTTGDPQEAKSVDSLLDGGWGLFRGWMKGDVQLPAELNPRLEAMTTLYRSLFAEGLSFLTLTFREEWAQSELRLRYIADNGYESILEERGGAPYLANIKDAHARYGQVLGITTPVKEEISPEVRANLEATINGMKEYVFKVMAWADVEEPGSEDLRDALLVPLTDWSDDAPSSGTTGGSATEGATTGD